MTPIQLVCEFSSSIRDGLQLLEKDVASQESEIEAILESHGCSADDLTNLSKLAQKSIRTRRKYIKDANQHITDCYDCIRQSREQQ